MSPGHFLSAVQVGITLIGILSGAFGEATPRVDVVYLDVEDSRDDTYRKILDNAHTVMPVCRGGIVNVLGIVHAKDLLRRSLSGEQFDLLSSLKSPLFVPETATAMTWLEMFKKSGRHVAFVVDEYGDVQGLVTINDVLGSIVGDIPSEGERAEALAVRRVDGLRGRWRCPIPTSGRTSNE